MSTKIIGTFGRCNTGERVNGFQYALRRCRPAHLAPPAQVVPDFPIMRAILFEQADGGCRNVLYVQSGHDPPQLGESTALKINAAWIFRGKVYFNPKWCANLRERPLIRLGKGIHPV